MRAGTESLVPGITATHVWGQDGVSVSVLTIHQRTTMPGPGQDTSLIATRPGSQVTRQTVTGLRDSASIEDH
jgi:hypothetical protein